MITIAIPTSDGRLFGHFGGCREFTFVQADPDTKKITGTKTLIPPEHVPGAFPRWVHEQGATVVIAGGIGGRALSLFEQQGIEVRAGEPGMLVEPLVMSYLNGRLADKPAGCTHHHDEQGNQPHHHE